MGRGKNALQKRFVLKALALLDAELELFNLRITHPAQFQPPKDRAKPSPLHLTDETTLVEIMELVSGLHLSKRAVSRSGAALPLTEIARAFENLFNIKFGDIHKKHDSVICRKPHKRTEFLDTLRKAIAEESKNQGYL